MLARRDPDAAVFVTSLLLLLVALPLLLLLLVLQVPLLTSPVLFIAPSQRVWHKEFMLSIKSTKAPVLEQILELLPLLLLLLPLLLVLVVPLLLLLPLQLLLLANAEGTT